MCVCSGRATQVDCVAGRPEENGLASVVSVPITSSLHHQRKYRGTMGLDIGVNFLVIGGVGGLIGHISTTKLKFRRNEGA